MTLTSVVPMEESNYDQLSTSVEPTSTASYGDNPDSGVGPETEESTSKKKLPIKERSRVTKSLHKMPPSSEDTPSPDIGTFPQPLPQLVEPDELKFSTTQLLEVQTTASGVMITGSDDTNHQCETYIMQLEDKLRDARAKLREKDKALEEKDKKIKMLEEKMRIYERESEENKQENEKMKEKYETAKSEKERVEEEHATLQLEVRDLKSQVSELDTKVETLQHNYKKVCEELCKMKDDREHDRGENECSRVVKEQVERNAEKLDLILSTLKLGKNGK